MYISYASQYIYIFTYLCPYTLTSCGYMESHFEFEFELRLRLRTHGSRPLARKLRHDYMRHVRMEHQFEHLTFMNSLNLNNFKDLCAYKNKVL